MKVGLRILVCACAILLVFSKTTTAQLNIQAIDVAGDSISKGYNAGSAAPCANADQEEYNWITSKTNGAVNLCSAGPEGVFSFLERAECDLNTTIFAKFRNSAASGARMLTDFETQANNIRSYLSFQSIPRLAAVFLGHNDNCGGAVTKVNPACPSADLDPNNYCRTRPASFERELRKGLDILMGISYTKIGVAAPVRVSQLCNFQNKASCQIPATCRVLWSNANICASLTRDCSPTRIVDTYITMKAYRDILKNVTAEYAAIPEGGRSRVVNIGGAVVGGATKAFATSFVYSDAPWQFRFSSDQLSCCDCFHPSAAGQNKLGQMMKSGLSCTSINPCCRETGDPLIDGQCARTEAKRIYYNGIF